MERPTEQPDHVDLAAECAVLAAVLIENDTLPRIASIIRSADDFHEPSHATVWKAFLALQGGASPIDVTTTAGKLREMNRLNAVGGPQFLGDLTDVIPTIAHCETHARIVADLARVRRMDLALQRARARLHEGGPDEGIGRAMECIAPNSLDTSQYYAAFARCAVLKSARTSSGDLNPFFCNLQ